VRVPPGSEATVAWLRTLLAPVRVVYETGPTGYRLARACAAAGISCVVAAPSRIRPAADRVKTDRRDAERLARLLRLGEITPVRTAPLLISHTRSCGTRPAHMSRDTDVDDSRCALPAEHASQPRAVHPAR